MKTGGKTRENGSKPVVGGTRNNKLSRQASLAASCKVSVSSFGC